MMPHAEVRRRRTVAIAQRLKRYQGNPCRNGHRGLRYAKSDSCVECTRNRVLKQRQGGKYIKPDAETKPVQSLFGAPLRAPKVQP